MAEEKNEHESLIEEAKERFRRCESAEHDIRVDALDDLKFRAGEQWPVKIKAVRDAQGRPCLTVNVLPARERQILNDQRQNRPAIHVNPVDDYGDPETAEVLQGIIRHIEYDSNADSAYDTGCASQVRGGFGYIGAIPEYESTLDEIIDKIKPQTGKRKIKIRRFRNPFTVYLDPSAQEADRSDANYGFAFTYYSKDDYKKEFKSKKDAALIGCDDWSGIGDRAPGWIREDGSVRVAEYFYKDTEKGTLCLYSDGTVGVKDKRKVPEGVTVAEEFPDQDVPIIKWCKLDGFDVLEETTLPGTGQWIPLVPILGDELEVDGKLILEGMVRHAKDACRMQNYLASAETEAIGVSKSGSIMAVEGQLEGHEQEWQNPNSRILHYKSMDVGGKPAPPPQPLNFEPPIAAISASRAQFNQDLQNITGIYDAQLGQKSNETTGKAINARKQQGQIGNFHFVDNLTRAIRQLGRVVLDWIPDVYDVPRVLRIIGEDGEQKTVKVNQQYDDNGVQRLYDLQVGRYDVTVSAGPSYQTKRQEAADSMIQMTQSYPQLMQVAGDLLVKNLDWPGAQDLAERLKKTLPPGLADEDEGDPKQQLQVMGQQMQQMKQAHDAINAYAQKLEQEKEGKVIETQGRAQIAQMQEAARVEIVKMQEATKLAVAQINASKDANQTIAEMELEQYKLLHGSAHDHAMQADAQAHQQNMADVQHQQALEQQDQAGQQALTQQQMAQANRPEHGA